MKNYDKSKLRSALLHWISAGCFIIATALSAATYIMSLPEIRARLFKLLSYFDKLELFIAGLNRWGALGVIMLLFALKAFVPTVPLSVIFIATGMVFPVPVAALINICGFAVLCSIKFFWGKKHGGGNAHKFLSRSATIKSFMKLGGNGNKWMLVLLRFIPFIPINTVSRLYGGTEINPLEFILYSVLGFLPRLISWSVVGCNVTNPFTAAFTAPIIVLLMISGISLLILNTLLNTIKKQETERK